MKKKIVIGILFCATVFCLAAIMGGCGEHEHTFADGWTSDAIYHWHSSTCYHKRYFSEKAKHDYSNGTCNICNFRYAETDGLEYKFVKSDGIKNTGYEVTGIGSAAETDLIIPEYYNDGINGKYPVVSIGKEAFKSNKTITSVLIPSGVTVIENSAFEMCQSLKNISLPDTLTTVEDFAFSDCRGFQELNLPRDLKTIGKYAFQYCYNSDYYKSVRVVLPEKIETVGAGAFEVLNRSPNEDFPPVGLYITNLRAFCAIDFKSPKSNPLYQMHNLYLNGTLVTELSIPDGITEIRNYTFVNERGVFGDDSPILKITIPDSVEIIGMSAFDGCNKVTEIKLPKNLKEIGDGACVQPQ